MLLRDLLLTGGGGVGGRVGPPGCQRPLSRAAAAFPAPRQVFLPTVLTPEKTGAIFPWTPEISMGNLVFLMGGKTLYVVGSGERVDLMLSHIDADGDTQTPCWGCGGRGWCRGTAAVCPRVMLVGVHAAPDLFMKGPMAALASLGGRHCLLHRPKQPVCTGEEGHWQPAQANVVAALLEDQAWPGLGQRGTQRWRPTANLFVLQAPRERGAPACAASAGGGEQRCQRQEGRQSHKALPAGAMPFTCAAG